MKDADVVIVGAGPAGLATAAVTAARGLSTLILDEQTAPGGQVWRAAERVLADRARHAALASSYSGAQAAIEAARTNATIRHSADVIDVSPERAVLWRDRAAGRLVETQATVLVVATGAMERPVMFPGWTLPGVIGAGALQIAMKEGGLLPDGPVVLAGQGPLLLLLARQLREAGATIAAMLDVGPALGSMAALRALPRALGADMRLLAEGASLALRRTLNTRVCRGVSELKAIGTDRIEAVAFGPDERQIACRLLAVHDGVIPATHLTRLLKLDHRWVAAQAAFVPVTDADGRASDGGVFVVGDGAGIAGAHVAAARGTVAGHAICRDLGRTADTPKEALDSAGKRVAARRFIDALYPPVPVAAFADEDTVLCRCEGVTFGAARAAVRSGASGPNRVKTATRCGMGPCQGRLCSGALTRLIAAETRRSAEDVGALRIRPPLKPVLLSEYAALAEEMG